jgi:hypothetical protein
MDGLRGLSSAFDARSRTAGEGELINRVINNDMKIPDPINLISVSIPQLLTAVRMKDVTPTGQIVRSLPLPLRP